MGIGRKYHLLTALDRQPFFGNYVGRSLDSRGRVTVRINDEQVLKKELSTTPSQLIISALDLAGTSNAIITTECG